MNEHKTLFIILIAGTLLFTYGLMRYTKKEPIEKDNSTLVIGTAAEFAPFEFIENDLIVGFDIDLIRQLAQRIGKKLEIHDLPFTTLIPQLQMGKIHAIIAGMTPTKERAESVLFTHKYINGDPMLIVSLKNKPQITALTNLNGKEVIVNEGFSSDVYLSKNNPEIRLKRLATIADAFMALRAGKGDAFVISKNTLQPFFEKYDRAEFNIFEIPGSQESAAIAVSKKYPDLREQLNKALDQMKQDGSLEGLKRKWKLS